MVIKIFLSDIRNKMLFRVSILFSPMESNSCSERNIGESQYRQTERWHAQVRRVHLSHSPRWQRFAALSVGRGSLRMSSGQEFAWSLQCIQTFGPRTGLARPCVPTWGSPGSPLARHQGRFQGKGEEEKVSSKETSGRVFRPVILN